MISFINIDESKLSNKKGLENSSKMLTLQDHYFGNNGLYLDHLTFKYNLKCEKQKHFINFSQNTYDNVDKNQDNLVFDIPDNHLKITPWTMK